MSRPVACLFLAAALLPACSTNPPRPALALEVRALSATRALVRLDSVPIHGHWEVRPSQECGGEDGAATAAGAWPTSTASLEVPAGAGDLVKVWAELEDGSTVTSSDCPV